MSELNWQPSPHAPGAFIAVRLRRDGKDFGEWHKLSMVDGWGDNQRVASLPGQIPVYLPPAWRDITIEAKMSKRRAAAIERDKLLKINRRYDVEVIHKKSKRAKKTQTVSIVMRGHPHAAIIEYSGSDRLADVSFTVRVPCSAMELYPS